MHSIVTARFPLLVERGGIRIPTTRLPRAAFAFRESASRNRRARGAGPPAPRRGDPPPRQPLLRRGTGLLVLAQALGPTGLPRGVRPPSRRRIRIHGAWISRVRRAKCAWR